MSTQIIESLKSQFESLELQIKELLILKSASSLLQITIIDHDISFDFQDILDSLQENQKLNNFPKIKDEISKLQELSQEENKKYLNVCEQIKQLELKKEELTLQLSSFFPDYYTLQINAAYDKQGKLIPEVEALLKLYPHLKSHKKYSHGDKFIIYFEKPITKNSLLSVVKEYVTDFNPNFKGLISIEKTIVNFHNYQHFI